MTPRTTWQMIEGIPVVESTSAYAKELKRLKRIMRTDSRNSRGEATYAVPISKFPPVPLPTRRRKLASTFDYE